MTSIHLCISIWRHFHNNLILSKLFSHGNHANITVGETGQYLMVTSVSSPCPPASTAFSNDIKVFSGASCTSTVRQNPSLTDNAHLKCFLHLILQITETCKKTIKTDWRLNKSRTTSLFSSVVPLVLPCDRGALAPDQAFLLL